MRYFVLLAAMLLLTSCVKPPVDRVVTGDGENITGELKSIDDGFVHFESGISVPVPNGAARVYIRNGASFSGRVGLEEGEVVVSTYGGNLEFAEDAVSAIVWGADNAESILIDVHARAGWQNTHLVVSEGDFLSLCAAGSVTLETGTSDPGGMDEFSTSTALVPESTSGELVMRIGVDYPPIVVGVAWSGNALYSGELYLAVNTPEQSTREVSGFYIVSVTLGEGTGAGSVAIYPAPE